MPNDFDDKYSVGYGKPPQQNRFKKGVSGNLRGRPRGAKNSATLLNKVLDEKVIIAENGTRKTITKREAAFKQLANKAAGGDARTIQLLLAELRTMETKAESSQSGTPLLQQDDIKVIEELQRLFNIREEDDDGSDKV
jgi:Family of unknown function (DUF5681)